MDATASSASPPTTEQPVNRAPHHPSMPNESAVTPAPTRFAVTPSTAPPPPMGERQLEVKDALSYLDEVKKRFDDRPDVYNKFLDIMKDFKSQILTTPDVIERVSALFRGHPPLVSGFNTFLPPGYRIECSTGENQRITVTTPSGTLTQDAAGNLTHDGHMPGPPPVPAIAASMLASEPPQVHELDGDTVVVEPAAESPKRDLSPPTLTYLSGPPTRPATPIPITLPPPPLPSSRAVTPQPQPPATSILAPVPFTPPPFPVPSRPATPAQPPNAGPPPFAVSTPVGLEPTIHPSHIPLPPLSQTIPGGPLVLTPAVTLNSSQTTESAASVLGGMHLVSSSPELAAQQQVAHQQQQPLQHPVHPPAVFHPSLPQAAHPPPPPSMGTPMQVGTPAGGPLIGLGMPSQPSPQPEFYHAIQYINRIKTRFSDEPETYKQFLEILQTYQKEQRALHDVYAQVTQLFRTAPELIDEFKMFLPDTSGTVMTPGLMTPTSFGAAPPGGTLGVMGVVGQVGPLGAIPGQTPPSGSSEWTMDVSTMGAKSDKSLSGHRRKTAPGETKGDGPPVKKRRKAIDKESTRAEREREKDKERERENIPVGVGTKTSSSRPRQPSSRVPEPPSPTFAPFGRPPSPSNGPHIPPHPIMHGHPHPSLPPHPHQASLQPSLPHPRPLTPLIPIVAAPELFFDRVNRALDDRDAWEEFLKLLNLYSSDIIDENLLVRAAAPFLGGVGSELEQQFREILGMDRYKNDKEKQMLASSSSNGWLTGSKSRFGPSYRRLPESETTLACSGRDELSRSVLNDEWVSHPVWASEEAGFVAHKKNSYEEVLHRTEDERHEFHVSLESMANTISLLEPIAFKLEQMTNEERVAFKLGPDLGSRSKSIHEKIIKRVYGGPYNAQEVLQCLQESPAVAVPVVLNRLKAVDAEWRRIKREWEKHWREVDLRNFYKSLDHQGLSFKVNDKKAITGKAFLTEIERIKKAQDRERDGIIDEGDNEHVIPGFVRPTQVLPRYQLEYDLGDASVLQDVIKLSICFLERNDQRHGQSNVLQYNTVERRRIEAFLRHYVVYQFALDPDFDAAFGAPIEQAEWEDLGLYVVVDGDAEESAPDDEDTTRKGARKSGKKSSGASSSGSAFSAGDLKKKLSKEKKGSQGRKTNDSSKVNSESNTSNHMSPISSRLATPMPEGSLPGTPKEGSRKSAKRKGKTRVNTLDDVWIRHAILNTPVQQSADRDTMEVDEETRSAKTRSNPHGSFFCNTNFYTLLRSLQLLYSRLIMCKNMATKLAKEGSKGFRPNPVAYSLGLVDTAGPVEYLNAVNAKEPTTNPAEHFYVYLLDLVEKVFDGELEQSVFEENMRFMFGTKAFIVFTLDKVCGAICKQVQAVVQDGRCHELMNMYEQQSAYKAQISVQGIIRHRRQAELLIGSDDLFRIDWSPDTKKLRIQLLDVDDLSLDPPLSLEDTPVAMDGSGHDAVDASMTLRCKQYIHSYVLRYPTEGRRIGVIQKPFLKRTLLDEDSDEVTESIWMADRPSGGLQIVVSPRTYRLFFGCEEALWRLRIRVRRNHDVEATTAKHLGRGGRRRRRSSPEEGGEEGEETDVSEWERLKERADARLREQRRWINQFDQGVALLR